MGLTRKDFLFLVKALAFSALMPVALVAAWALCIDWSGPVDDLKAEDRAAMENCIMAERSLGDSIYQERPDCRAFLDPPIAARSPATATLP